MKRLCAALVLLGTPCWADLDFNTHRNVYKAKPDEESFESVFTFKNTGKHPVVIQSVDSNCGCIRATADKERYGKGESGTITAVFKIGGGEGIQTKHVSVLYAEEQPVVKPKVIAPAAGDLATAPVVEPATPPKPVLGPAITDRLSVELHVPTLVQVEPKITKWTVGQAADPKTVRVTMNHEQPIILKEVRSSRENVTVETKEIETGKIYELTLTPASTDKVQLGMLTLVTDCEIKKHQKKLAFFSIQRAQSRPEPAPQPAPEVPAEAAPQAADAVTAESSTKASSSL